MINEDLNNEINRGHFQGKSKEDLKPLYIRRNTFDVPLASDIYRIYESKYFLEDIKSAEITLVNINSKVFGDPLENPLEDREFTDGSDKFTLGFLKNYFGLSWTEESSDDAWRWSSFTNHSSGIRVKVSLKNLMERLSDTRDEFFMLHYFAGRVSYHDEATIEYWRKTSHYTDFLDSLGQLSALSLTALRNDFSEEKEVRILYSYMPNDNDFVKNKVKVEGGLCKLPFDWSGIVEEVLYDKRMTAPEISSLKSELKNAGINCKVECSAAA